MESELLLTPEVSEKLLNRVFDVAKPPPEFRATIKTLIAEVWEESQYKARQHYEQEEPEWAGARHMNFDDEQKRLDRPREEMAKTLYAIVANELSLFIDELRIEVRKPLDWEELSESKVKRSN